MLIIFKDEVDQVLDIGNDMEQHWKRIKVLLTVF